MSNTYALKQIGLMVGLVASVAVGAAIVLWLWMPGSDGYSDNSSAAYNSFSLQNERAQLITQERYNHNRIVPLDNDERKILTHSGIQLEYTQKLEASYTQRIERLLEPLLGTNSIRAQVTADIDFTARERTLETYNPDTLVLRNKELEESINDRDSGDKSGSPNKLRREVNSYELDKTISHTRSAIGRINKLSIAVIVDDKLTRGVKGNTIRTPRTEKELNKFTDLVKKAVGFNAKRGDIVNVIGTSFKTYRSQSRQLQNNTTTIPSWKQIWVKDLFNKALGTFLVLLLIFTVIRPAIKSLVSMPAHFGGNASDNKLNSGKGTSDDNDPENYDKNMIRATKVVESDPKLVAQIMKNWVSADGT